MKNFAFRPCDASLSSAPALSADGKRARQRLLKEKLRFLAAAPTRLRVAPASKWTKRSGIGLSAMHSIFETAFGFCRRSPAV
ncbi:hypothetical protein [Lysobacter enzymogenes]|uniref:hypothetical protein n=1 Tax=Lysobacter enzymogenes TaxID=69 RepID=UPI0011163A34|nr:hypothetical protein [Lysobacter enzymogenes]UZW61934.1 hypothetical protein BV903_006435 [Lysobacter enzymogenes]